MAVWYWAQNGERHGPIGSQELKSLANSGRLRPEDLVWREGIAEWVSAGSIRGLFLESNSLAPPPFVMPAAEGTPQGRTLPSTEAALIAAKRHATQLFDDLRSLNFRQEVIPLDEGTLRQIARSFVFWSMMVLGVIPLLIITINRLDYQLTSFLLFFAFIWGFAIKSFIVRSRGGWGLLIASLFLTGIVGIHSLLYVYGHFLPASYLGLAKSRNGIVSLLGYIVQVGLCEEMLEALPLIGYLVWKRKRAEPYTALLIAVFSGLGFAAFENDAYNLQAIGRVFELSREFGLNGLVRGIQEAMLTPLLRSLSLVLCHAIWSGILAYFLVVALITQRRFVAMFLVGLSLAAVLHGVYDWLASMQPTFAALIVALSFVLFYAYTMRLRQLVDGETEAGRAVPAPISLQLMSAPTNGAVSGNSNLVQPQ